MSTFVFIKKYLTVALLQFILHFIAIIYLNHCQLYSTHLYIFYCSAAAATSAVVVNKII